MELESWKFSLLRELSGAILEDHCQAPEQRFLPAEAEPLQLKQSDWREKRRGRRVSEQYGSENGTGHQIYNTRNRFAVPETGARGLGL